MEEMKMARIGGGIGLGIVIHRDNNPQTKVTPPDTKNVVFNGQQVTSNGVEVVVA